MNEDISIGRRIAAAVMAWPGVERVAHRFGGIEFRLGKRELGHLHGDALVDLPFPRKVRDELVAAGRARPHHVLPDSGWVSFSIESPGDVERAIALIRLAYERAVAARARARGGVSLLPEVDSGRVARRAVRGGPAEQTSNVRSLLLDGRVALVTGGGSGIGRAPPVRSAPGSWTCSHRTTRAAEVSSAASRRWRGSRQERSGRPCSSYENGALLPGPPATLAGPTFEEWLDLSS